MSTRPIELRARTLKPLDECRDNPEILTFPAALSPEHRREMGVHRADYFLLLPVHKNGTVVFQRNSGPPRKFAIPAAQVLVDFEQRRIWLLTGKGVISDVHSKEDQAALLSRLSAMGDRSSPRRWAIDSSAPTQSP